MCYIASSKCYKLRPGGLSYSFMFPCHIKEHLDNFIWPLFKKHGTSICIRYLIVVLVIASCEAESTFSSTRTVYKGKSRRCKWHMLITAVLPKMISGSCHSNSFIYFRLAVVFTITSISQTISFIGPGAVIFWTCKVNIVTFSLYVRLMLPPLSKIVGNSLQ